MVVRVYYFAYSCVLTSLLTCVLWTRVMSTTDRVRSILSTSKYYAVTKHQLFLCNQRFYPRLGSVYLIKPRSGHDSVMCHLGFASGEKLRGKCQKQQREMNNRKMCDSHNCTPSLTPEYICPKTSRSVSVTGHRLLGDRKGNTVTD